MEALEVEERPREIFRGGIAFDTRVSLTMDDAKALEEARYIAAIVPELSRNLQVKRNNQNINVSVLGTTANYVPVRSYTITAGRMFTTGDDESRRRVAVLGAAVPPMFNANPAGMIGQEIQIRGIPFEVIGILSEKGSQAASTIPTSRS